MGERTAIFFADGFEDCEGLITVDMFRRAGLRIDTISMNAEKEVHTSHGVTLFADTTFSGIDASDYDVLILPGGKKGVANLEASEPLKAAYRKHYEAGKLSGAICAAPSILGHMGLLRGKTYTCFPSYRNISQALGVTKKTVSKYVGELVDKGLIETRHTHMTAKDGTAPPCLYIST